MITFALFEVCLSSILQYLISQGNMRLKVNISNKNKFDKTGTKVNHLACVLSLSIFPHYPVSPDRCHILHYLFVSFAFHIDRGYGCFLPLMSNRMCATWTVRASFCDLQIIFSSDSKWKCRHRCYMLVNSNDKSNNSLQLF